MDLVGLGGIRQSPTETSLRTRFLKKRLNPTTMVRPDFPVFPLKRKYPWYPDLLMCSSRFLLLCFADVWCRLGYFDFYGSSCRLLIMNVAYTYSCSDFCWSFFGFCCCLVCLPFVFIERIVNCRYPCICALMLVLHV